MNKTILFIDVNENMTAGFNAQAVAASAACGLKPAVMWDCDSQLDQNYLQRFKMPERLPSWQLLDAQSYLIAHH